MLVWGSYFSYPFSPEMMSRKIPADDCGTSSTLPHNSYVKMNSYENRENSVNDTHGGVSLGTDLRAQQPGPGRNQATARMKWTKEVNKLVIK